MNNPDFGRSTPWTRASVCRLCGRAIHREHKIPDGFTDWWHIDTGSLFCDRAGSRLAEPVAEQLEIEP